MIELPRAALLAGEIAESAEFFSFGTNDLTQTVYGISRDDAASFLGRLSEGRNLRARPVRQHRHEGVGELVRIAAERGRATRPGIKLGICGEHGGDPASIHFCREIGLDYVSCSPYRVPIARLAAAQAELAGESGRRHGVAKTRSVARLVAGLTAGCSPADRMPVTRREWPPASPGTSNPRSKLRFIREALPSDRADRVSRNLTGIAADFAANSATGAEV